MISWHIINRKAYDEGLKANQIREDALYFLSDTREIYRGTVSYSETCIFYDTDEPTTMLPNRLYINTNTLEGRIWNGNTWTIIVQKPASEVDPGNDTAPVTGKAVAGYVQDQMDQIRSMTLDEIDQLLQLI